MQVQEEVEVLFLVRTIARPSATNRVVAARAARVDAVAPMTSAEAAKVVISMLHGTLLLELDGVVLEAEDSAEWAERLAVVIHFGFSRPKSAA